MLQTYTTRVQMPQGNSIPVYVQANSPGEAKQLFESQYAGYRILHLPMPA